MKFRFVLFLDEIGGGDYYIKLIKVILYNFLSFLEFVDFIFIF